MSGDTSNPNNKGQNTNKKLLELRKLRGASILAKGDVPQAVSQEEFLVLSQSTNKKYKVTHKQEWTCECEDFKHRRVECKHIQAIKFWQKLKNKIELEDFDLEEALNEKVCPNCKSENIVKDGIRNNKNGAKQRYLCKESINN